MIYGRPNGNCHSALASTEIKLVGQKFEYRMSEKIFPHRKAGVAAACSKTDRNSLIFMIYLYFTNWKKSNWKMKNGV
jgi:hypothetical protein